MSKEPINISAAFAGFDPQHPFYLAVSQLLDEAVVAEQDAVAMPDLTDGGRHFNGGRLAHAKDFRNEFHGRMRDAIAEQARQAQLEEIRAQRAQAQADEAPQG